MYQKQRLLPSASLALALLALLSLLIGCGGGGAGGQRRSVSVDTQQEFTVVLLPDTQYYSQEGHGASMEMFYAQTRWIAANEDKENIRAVVGLGDIVQCGEDRRQWQNARDAYSALDDAGIPYVPTIGNHDYDGRCGGMNEGRSARNYNSYFGPRVMADRPGYGDSNFPEGSNENFYVTFNGAGRKYLVLALEFYPRDAALRWAQQVLSRFSDHEVIVATHSCVDHGNTFVEAGDTRGPRDYGLKDGNSGRQLFEKLVRKNRNVIMVVNGHIQGVGRLARKNDNGRMVPHMLSNFQGYPRGGQGYLRRLKFRPATGEIQVSTYSPYLEKSLTDRKNQFTLKYEHR